VRQGDHRDPGRQGSGEEGFPGEHFPGDLGGEEEEGEMLERFAPAELK
jgi:hypothetical protein